jgi:hypothetical protein
MITAEYHVLRIKIMATAESHLFSKVTVPAK